MKRIIMFAACCAIVLPAFAQDIASVNGKPITQKAVDQFVKLLISQGATDSPELRKQVKDEMINRQVFVQKAENSGLAEKTDIQAEIELARQGILVRALMTDYLAKHPITDARVTAEYNKIKKSQEGQQEYKVRHILVKDKKTAQDLLVQISADKKKFSDLAQKNSQDPGSAKKGGDLGWAQTSNYVKPFANAVTTIKNGEFSTVPVQTQFGWHIIMVEDSRPIELQPVDQVKPQIEEMLRQQTLASYQNKLRQKAKIQ